MNKASWDLQNYERKRMNIHVINVLEGEGKRRELEGQCYIHTPTNFALHNCSLLQCRDADTCSIYTLLNAYFCT